jgi:hypothetical protein
MWFVLFVTQQIMEALMPLKLFIAVFATVAMLSAVPPGPLEAADAPTVVLTESVHFTGMEGQDLLIEPGSYSLQPGDGKKLLLIPVEVERSSASRALEAVTTAHDLDITATVALAVRPQENEYHLILATPEKQVYESVGFAGDVRPRAAIQPLPPMQLRQLVAQRAQGQAGAISPRIVGRVGAPIQGRALMLSPQQKLTLATSLVQVTEPGSLVKGIVSSVLLTPRTPYIPGLAALSFYEYSSGGVNYSTQFNSGDQAVGTVTLFSGGNNTDNEIWIDFMSIMPGSSYLLLLTVGPQPASEASIRIEPLKQMVTLKTFSTVPVYFSATTGGPQRIYLYVPYNQTLSFDSCEIIRLNK